MLKLRTLKVFALIVATYALLVIPGFIWPSYFESPAGLLVLVPGMSVYFFNYVGVPGLLEHNGFCGWGWCSPTLFGMVFVVTFWVVAVWCVARGIAALISRYAVRKA